MALKKKKTYVSAERAILLGEQVSVTERINVKGSNSTDN